MMAFLLVWMVFYLRSAARAAREVPRHEDYDRPRFLRLYMGLFFAFLFAPIAARRPVLVQLGRSLQRFDGFSLEWYEAFFENESLRGRCARASRSRRDHDRRDGPRHAARARARARAHALAGGANVLMLIPLVTPEIVAGVSAFVLFTQIGLQLSLLTIMLAHITFSISYVTVVVRARLAALHPEVEQAAMDLGATRLQTVRLVVLPGAVAGDPGERRCWPSRCRSTTSCSRSSPPASRRSRCRCGSGRRSASA